MRNRAKHLSSRNPLRPSPYAHSARHTRSTQTRHNGTAKTKRSSLVKMSNITVRSLRWRHEDAEPLEYWTSQPPPLTLYEVLDIRAQLLGIDPWHPTPVASAVPSVASSDDEEDKQAPHVTLVIFACRHSETVRGDDIRETTHHESSEMCAACRGWRPKRLGAWERLRRWRKGTTWKGVWYKKRPPVHPDDFWLDHGDFVAELADEDEREDDTEREDEASE